MASFTGFHRLQARPSLVSAAPARPCFSWHRTRWRGAQHATRPSARLRHVTFPAAGEQQPGAGSIPADASLLQLLLAEKGVADWRAYDKPHHAAIVGEAAEQFAAKVAELVREGVTAEDVDRLFRQRGSRVSTSNLEDVFLPNLAYLRGLLAGAKNERKAGEPDGLTPLGRLLHRQPSDISIALSRKPELVLELDRWVCGELGLAREDLAAVALRSPKLLYISVDAGRSAAAFLEGELGLQQEQVKRLLLRMPSLLSLKPHSLSEKVRKLRSILGIDQLRASRLIVSQPRLFLCTLDELPAVLSELDALFGREGAGAAIVMKDPIVATLSLARLRRSLKVLQELGLDEGAVVAVVDSKPAVLIKDLESKVQQQKRVWAEAELNWSVQKMFANKLFECNLCRMASRLAFMRQLGLPDPESLWLIGSLAEPTFLGQLSKRVGQEVDKAEFDAFVAEWLCTEQGRKYGCKPDTPPPQRRKRNTRAAPNKEGLE